MDGSLWGVPLNDDERSRLDDLAASFQSRPSEPFAQRIKALQALLPPRNEPLHRPALWRLISADLERSWSEGDGKLIEEYTTSLADLDASDLPPEIIAAEYRARAATGPAPDLAEYQQRFPHQFADTERLLADFRFQGTLIPPARNVEGASTVPLTHDQTDVPAKNLPPDSPSESSPETVGGGRYALLRPLGRGMFGEVWLGEAPGGVHVAIKIIRFPLGHHMTFQEQRALEVMKTMKHPFLIQVQAYWEENEQLIIVMDLAEKTLADRLEECTQSGLAGIPQTELFAYMRAAAEALDYLHGRDVIHRDIKPANLLLTENFAKVGDFGIARVLERHDASVRATVAGTPLYIAPEMFDGKPCPASDQYSLAVTYTELRTGQPPLEGESVLELMKAHATRTPELNNLASAERPIVQRALAKRPDDRFPDCASFAKALEESVRESPPPPRRRWLYASAALCAGVGAATLGILNWPRDKTFVPQGCVPAENAQLVTCHDMLDIQLYDEVLLDAQGLAVPMRLIPSNANNANDPRSFYIMKHKVSNQLFASLMPAAAAEGCEAPTPKLPDHPVFCVTAREAHEFAQRLGGRLPTPAQWDKAAGEFDAPPSPGPYLRSWSPSDREGIAINRNSGPLPVGQAAADESPYKVRDMAGNGLEWTDEVYWNNENQLLSAVIDELEPADWASVTLRGRGYTATEPYQYDAEQEIPPQYFVADPETSFRIAIQIRVSTGNDN